MNYVLVFIENPPPEILPAKFSVVGAKWYANQKNAIRYMKPDLWLSRDREGVWALYARPEGYIEFKIFKVITDGTR